MTVEEWLRSRTPVPPGPLLDRIAAHLGDDAQQDSARTAEVCAAAGVRVVTHLISDRCADRQNALDLLAADALVTYAIESASGDAVHPGVDMDALVMQFAGIATRTPA